MQGFRADAIKKRLKQREDMFSRRLMGMILKMAIFRTSSHPKYDIIQGVFGGWFLRSAQVGWASESFILHHQVSPMGGTSDLAFEERI